jgi:hypothetical protein
MHMVENALHIGLSFACLGVIFEGHAKGEEEKWHGVFTCLVKDASFMEAFFA